MPFDAYTIYCNHQRQRGQPCPSREWWDNAIAAQRTSRAPRSDAQFDHDTERKEGWAND